MVAETWAAWMTNGMDGGDNEKGKQKTPVNTCFQ